MSGAERRFARLVLVLFLAVDAAIIAAAAASWSGMVPDFFGIWSTARFMRSHHAEQVYDLTLLGAFQHALRPDFTAVYPAPYSPVFLLLIRPLGWLSVGWAQLVWVGATLAAFAWAGWRVLRQAELFALLLFAPLTALNAIYGQTGFLTAALMIGAIAIAPERPVLAGLCLALLSFKPQLGLLMPVVLLARRDWASLIAGIVWMVGLFLLSSAILGGSVWWDWLGNLAGHGELIAQNRAHMIGIMATITSATLSLGAEPQLARIAQVGAALIVMAIVWSAWRREAGVLAAAVTWVGGFLVTPYAFVYDTPVAMAAALLYLGHGRGSGRELSAVDLAAVIFVLVAPLFILAAPPQPPAAAISLLVLFAILARRIAVRPR